MIRLIDLNRFFTVGDQQVHALDHVNLEIEQGEYVAIMGQSGSGKSTLLNMIGLLDQPSSGSYQLNGVETTALPSRQQARLRSEEIGFVFQQFHLIPRMTAAENVELPLVLAGIEPSSRHPRVDKALAAMGMTDRASHRPDQLSGGQRQRVAIARATIMQPSIVLADEPTGNLDRHSGEEVMKTLETMHEAGITLILVTHDPEMGRRAHRMISMVDGRIIDDQAQ
jgi:putative ABC transport system ATP-binding protein